MERKDYLKDPVEHIKIAGALTVDQLMAQFKNSGLLGAGRLAAACDIYEKMIDEECCGNWDSHNSYCYPTKVFCSTRYDKNQDPIVDTLWRCDDYNKVSQQCYCAREALKAKNDTEE